MIKNISLKSCFPHCFAIVAFVAVSLIYFFPEIFQNKTLYQHDIVVGMGVGNELAEFKAKTGERSYWSNAQFGGMPTYQIGTSYPSQTTLRFVQGATCLFLPSPASIIFILLCGAYILFLALRINPWLAIPGAIAYAFSSYFFIIIQAGHIWKVLTLAYIPPTFAGIIWIYNGKYLRGAAVAAIYFALQLVSNHPQMTYYFGLTVLVFVIREFVVTFKNAKYLHFIKASAALLLAVAIAFTMNLSHMYHTADYAKQSIRGGTELSSDIENQSNGGLERDYITGWSYGIGETFSLMIPNVKGGASNYIGNSKTNADKVINAVKNDSRIPNQIKNNVAQQIMYQSVYWADQPGTSGPVYVGAFIVFLFIFGLFVVSNGIKWALLIATVMSIVLAWGSNFMWLTNLFIDYMPYYNKLRAVSSMLVIAELCIPMLALLALNEIVKNPSILKEKKDKFYIALGCTGGLTLLFILLPKLFFNFLSDAEAAAFAEQSSSQPLYAALQDILENLRISIFRADAWRSLAVIAVGAGLIMMFARKKINAAAFIAALTVLVTVDLWDVNKRYLNGEQFKPKQKSISAITPQTPVDKEILKDKDLEYRVYNLSVDPFNDATTSIYHKSLGGYNGAKMQRYQDIIKYYLKNINAQNVQSLKGTKQFNVPNMLNARYIILPEGQLLQNADGALGNSWFVDEIKWVDNADEEIAALADFDPRHTAVIDKHFESAELKNLVFAPDSLSSITLVEYSPNKLIYESDAASAKLAVFSEVYYPKGWHAYIDGNETPIWRADYILRAIIVPEGKHKIEMRFDPDSYYTTERFALLGYALLVGLLIASLFTKLKIKKELKIKN